MSQTESFFQTLKKLLSPTLEMTVVDDKTATPKDLSAHTLEEKATDVLDSAVGLRGEEFMAVEALQTLDLQRNEQIDLYPTFTHDVDLTNFTQDDVPAFNESTVFTNQLVDFTAAYLEEGTTTINQVMLDTNHANEEIDDYSTSSYIIDSRAPIVVPRLLWFQHDLTEAEKQELLDMKKKSPIWFKHVSVSGMFIGGTFSSLFTTARKMVYAKKPDNTSLADLSNLFNEHTSIAKVPMKEGPKIKTDLRIHGNLPLVYGTTFRYAIKLRLNKVRTGSRKFQPYLFISKSLVGCRDYVFDETKQPPNDQAYTIEDKEKYAASGLGLFADRDFVKNEHIGLYCGN